MMTQRITVECYAGGRADERPHRVTIEGREHTVARLLAESVEESPVTRIRTRRYRVLTLEGLILEIVRTGDGWYLHATRPAGRD